MFSIGAENRLVWHHSARIPVGLSYFFCRFRKSFREPVELVSVTMQVKQQLNNIHFDKIYGLVYNFNKSAEVLHSAQSDWPNAGEHSLRHLFYIQYPRPVVDCAPHVTADRPAHGSAQSITGRGYCLNVIGVLLYK